VKIVGVPGEMRIRQFLNASQKLFPLKELISEAKPFGATVVVYLGLFSLLPTSCLIYDGGPRRETSDLSQFLVFCCANRHFTLSRLSIYLSIYLATQRPFLGPWQLFQFLDLLHSL
jgi:hypothetical protein